MDFLTSINLITLFAIIGGIGFVFLVASLVLGDIFEMFGGETDLGGDGADFGLFDSRVIAVFVTAFGGFGTIAAWSGYGAIASSMAGLLGGLIFGGVVSAFGRFLVSQQASSTVTDDDLIGRTAQVTVAIKPGTLGQITARVGDERVERLARASSDAEIAAGSIVTIKSIAGDSVIVAPEG